MRLQELFEGIVNGMWLDEIKYLWRGMRDEVKEVCEGEVRWQKCF